MIDKRSFLDALPSGATKATLRGIFLALESAGIAAVVFDPDEKLLVCTEAYLALYADMRDKLVPGADFQNLCALVVEYRSIGDVSDAEYLADRYEKFLNPPAEFEEQHTDGRWFRLQDIRTADGYYIGMRQDITETRTAVDEKDKIEQRFRLLADLASDFFWEMNADLRFRNFFGRDAEFAFDHAGGRTRWETATETDLQDGVKWADHRARLEAQQSFQDFEYEVRTDPPTWARVSGAPVFDDGGNFTGYLGKTTNITAQKHSELRMRQSEDRYCNLVEGSVQGIVVHADDRALFVNQAVADILGYSMAELYDLPSLSALFTEESRVKHREFSALRLQVDETIPNEYETEWLRKDGVVISIRQYSQSVIWDGQSAVQATVADITQQKQAAAAIYESVQRIRLIADGLPINIVYVDQEQRYRFVNNAYLAWYGQDASEILGRRVEDIMGREAYAFVGDQIDAALKGQQQNFELEIPFKLVGRKFVQVMYVPHQDEQGVVQGIYGLVIDISERRQAEQAARDSEARFSRMLAIAPDAIIATDGELRITVFNRGAENVFGYASEEVLGRSIDLLIPERFHKHHAGHVHSFVNSDEDSRMMSSRGEIFGQRKDGTEFPAEASISRLRIEQEEVLTVMLHDISDRKEAEAELITAKERAEYADRAKSEFLANMSHELRTPLNAIIGFSEMMTRQTFGPLGDRHYEEYSVGIFDSGDHLLSLINDILDISKIEAGQTEIAEENLVVEDVVHDCQRLVEPRASDAGVTIRNLVGSELPALRADGRQVKQMLLNLLSNSVKFTDKGGEIVIVAEIAPDGDLRISVTDNGIGIAHKDIPKAMSTFGQVDGALDRKFEGTGLGLPLVRSLVELHGGGFELISEVGVGTTSTVRFPKERVVSSTP